MGVNFPDIAPEGRSSTDTGKEILARSVEAHDGPLADRIRAESDWRRAYPQYFEDVLRVEAQSSAGCLEIAAAGLSAAADAFVYVSDAGESPLAGSDPAAWRDPAHPGFGSVEVQGTDEPVRELRVPYRGEDLRGNALLRQLDDWVHRGIVEPSFAEAIGLVVRNPQWLDLRDRTFALAGAGSQMGPFVQLMGWGATVAAIDLPRAATWERLGSIAHEGAGRLIAPVRRDAPRLAGIDDADVSARAEALSDSAGANLLVDVAPLVEWLDRVPGPLTFGNYGYADGALFVRLTMAVDALLQGLADARDDLSVCYLATPSDVFLVPIRAVDMARRRHASAEPLAVAGRALHAATAGRYFAPNYTHDSVIETATHRVGIVNAFITAQGQNYALAKRLQRWRMIQSRADGLLTSVHVAPPTRTASVHSNPLMARRQQLTAYLGIETFDAGAVETLAGAILVHDLRNPSAPANPATPLGHPHEAFMFAANPGGRWRVPFDLNASVPLVDSLSGAVSSAAGRAKGVADGLLQSVRRRS